MPRCYGNSSQIMNIHNIIHIADDVINIGAPISQFSAFDFENSLGYIKSIINLQLIQFLKFRENGTFSIPTDRQIKFP